MGILQKLADRATRRRFDRRLHRIARKSAARRSVPYEQALADVATALALDLAFHPDPSAETREARRDRIVTLLEQADREGWRKR